MSLGKVGLIGRFKPLHHGGALMLEAICQNADSVIIGIGSSNKYNLRNPFTAQESQEMLAGYLSSRFANYTFVHVPDFGHLPQYGDGKRWRDYVTSHMGVLDYFFTGNLYVKTILENDYTILHPAQLIPKDQWIKLRATEVRLEMARGERWRSLVPESVAEYLEQQDLVSRFRREFGPQLLGNVPASSDYRRAETAAEELLHTRET